MIRVGVVSYLNAWPLVGDLQAEPRLDLRFAPPATVAAELLAGRSDVALVPSITLARDPELTWIPGLCIGADGPVESVLLFVRQGSGIDQPPRRVRLDPHSRTSQMLARLVLADRYGAFDAEIVEESPREILARGGQGVDAFLVIGDLALRAAAPAGFVRLDLAAEWRRRTDLPFVFAVWALRRTLLEREPWLVARFRDALTAGRRNVSRLAAEHAASHGIEAATAERYLDAVIRYEMGEREATGMKLFLERAAAMG